MARSIEDYPGFAELTDFQKRIVEYLTGVDRGYGGSGTWEIAQKAFPERWKRRAARGVMIAHIRKAGYAMKEFTGVCPARDRWGEARLFLFDRVWNFINGEGQA